MKAIAKSLWEETEKENVDPKDKIRIAPLLMKCHADIRKAIAEEPSVLHRRNYLNKMMANKNEENMKKNEHEGISNSDLGLPENTNFRT